MQDVKIDTTQSGETPAPDASNPAPAKTGDAAGAGSTQAAPAKKPSKFGQIVGGILGGALNAVAPGAGSLIGNLIGGGGGPNFGSMEQLLNNSAQQQMQMLTIQERVQTQTQEFATISNLLKARHDSEMAAVNNFKS